MYIPIKLCTRRHRHCVRSPYWILKWLPHKYGFGCDSASKQHIIMIWFGVWHSIFRDNESICDDHDIQDDCHDKLHYAKQAYFSIISNYWVVLLVICWFDYGAAQTLWLMYVSMHTSMLAYSFVWFVCFYGSVCVFF